QLRSKSPEPSTKFSSRLTAPTTEVGAAAAAGCDAFVGPARGARLARPLKRRATDVPAFVNKPGTSNGLTEAINGRLEHLFGSALGFRNLAYQIARCLLESGGFRPVLYSHLR